MEGISNRMETRKKMEEVCNKMEEIRNKMEGAIRWGTRSRMKKTRNKMEEICPIVFSEDGTVTFFFTSYVRRSHVGLFFGSTRRPCFPSRSISDQTAVLLVSSGFPLTIIIPPSLRAQPSPR
jgi:hypothetical protein